MPEQPLKGATIVFDLDGTLVDTAPDLLRALDATLAREGLPPAPMADLRAFVGHGARAMLQKALDSHGAPPRSDAELAALTETFVEIYAEDLAGASRPYPHVPETLDALAADGAILAVCTNKRQALSVALLEALGLAPRFAAIVGSDAAPARKPDPIHYRTAVTAALGDLARSMMVGDSAPDVAAAQAAGARCAIVRFGYSPVAVETLGADALIDSYAQLPALARAWLSK